jgi:hypothetical protein
VRQGAELPFASAGMLVAANGRPTAKTGSTRSGSGLGPGAYFLLSRAGPLTVRKIVVLPAGR